jgi:hypothetical protein
MTKVANMTSPVPAVIARDVPKGRAIFASGKLVQGFPRKPDRNLSAK